MKISKIFNLGKSQRELDFIDININKDIPLFIDPYFLSNRKDSWSLTASNTISDFFQRVIDLVKGNNTYEAKQLFEFLGEPNQTCLGLSRGRPRGRGVGKDNANKIFKSLLKSKSIESGLVQDLEDSIIFVDGIGRDKLSDMATNIIKKNLIEYTKEQCKLWDIRLDKGVPTGYFWNIDKGIWETEYSEMLVVNNRIILLVPKAIVSYCDDYTPSKYYNHFVLNFLQNENLRLNTSLIQYRKDKSKYVTKKSVAEETPYSKEFLRKFTKNNPDIFKNFKRETKTKLSSLENEDFDISNLNHIIDKIITELKKIPTGNSSANNYHKLVKGILELVYYPMLIHPKLEKEIHEGRKRIDISFDNAAKKGIFHRLHTKFNLPCQYIYFECKNYNSDPNNPELDQLSGRFSLNRGKVGFLLCRNINNMKLFLQRCSDTYKDDRGLVIPITDNDIISMLEKVSIRNYNYIDDFLSDRIREIIHL